MIITASEANRRVKELVDNKPAKELNRIEELIKEAIMQEEYTIYLNKNLSLAIILKLRELGYTVDVPSKRELGEFYISVSWEKLAPDNIVTYIFESEHLELTLGRAYTIVNTFGGIDGYKVEVLNDSGVLESYPTRCFTRVLRGGF